MVLGLVDRDRLSQRISPANEESDFRLVVEGLRRTERRRERVGQSALAHWPAHGGVAHDDRRGPSVIRDRDVLVVGQQRIIRAKQLPDVRRVVDRGVEIGVIANRDRQPELDVGHADQDAVRAIARATRARVVGGEERARPGAQRAHRGSPGREEGVERRPATQTRRLACGTRERARVERGDDVEDPIANRDPNASRTRRRAREYSQRKVLNREIGVRRVRGYDPGAKRGVMRMIDAAGRRHNSPRATRSSIGSRNEQEPNAIAKCARTSRSCSVRR